jgi:hypothetical protein
MRIITKAFSQRAKREETKKQYGDEDARTRAHLGRV